MADALSKVRQKRFRRHSSASAAGPRPADHRTIEGVAPEAGTGVPGPLPLADDAPCHDPATPPSPRGQAQGSEDAHARQTSSPNVRRVRERPAPSRRKRTNGVVFLSLLPPFAHVRADRRLLPCRSPSARRSPTSRSISQLAEGPRERSAPNADVRGARRVFEKFGRRASTRRSQSSPTKRRRSACSSFRGGGGGTRRARPKAGPRRTGSFWRCYAIAWRAPGFAGEAGRQDEIRRARRCPRSILPIAWLFLGVPSGSPVSPRDNGNDRGLSGESRVKPVGGQRFPNRSAIASRQTSKYGSQRTAELPRKRPERPLKGYWNNPEARRRNRIDRERVAAYRRSRGEISGSDRIHPYERAPEDVLVAVERREASAPGRGSSPSWGDATFRTGAL